MRGHLTDLVHAIAAQRTRQRSLAMNPRSKPRCIVGNLLALSSAFLFVLGGPALGQESRRTRDQVVEQPEPYSPYVDQHFPQRVFFGDTHHHSSFSVGQRLDRKPARPGRELPVRPWRGGRLQHRPAGTTDPAAGFPGGLGPRGVSRHRRSSQHRKPRIAGNRSGPGVVRTPCRRAGRPPGSQSLQ